MSVKKERRPGGKQRRHFSAEEKVKILRQHLLEQKPVSDLCEQHQIHPTLFYRWQQEFFENGTAAFERRDGSTHKTLEKKVETMQAKLRQKDEVIAEIMQAHVELKKSLGEL
jgi:transposase-like protein